MVCKKRSTCTACGSFVLNTRDASKIEIEINAINFEAFPSLACLYILSACFASVCC